MINTILSEIKAALRHGLYLSALSLALTLPDICGKAAFPSCRTAERYITWYDTHIGQYDMDNGAPPNTVKSSFPALNGKIVYSLRCSLLHQGTPSISKKKFEITHFSLIVQKETDDFPAYLPEEFGYCRETGKKEMKIHLNVLCWRLCEAAEEYYRQNRDKFDFFDYDLIDGNEQAAMMCHR